MRWVSCLSFTLVLLWVMSVGETCVAQEKVKEQKAKEQKSTEKKAAEKTEKKATEEKVELKDVPKVVLDAVKKRFPKGEMTDGSKEEEDGKTIYEVSVTQDGKNIDVSLTPDGKLTMIEKTIDSKDLPKKITEGVEKKYLKPTYNLAEEVTLVADGKETLGYYEVLVTTSDKKKVEIEVALDGSIKKEEDKSGDKDDEKKEKDEKDKKDAKKDTKEKVEKKDKGEKKDK